MEERHVVLGVPHIGDFKPYFVDTLLTLFKGPSWSFSRVQNKPVDMARNMIAQTFLANPKATHLFFMDSDQMFPPEALMRLLSRDKDIVGGTYFARTETPIPHAYNYVKDEADPETGDMRRWYRTLGKEFAGWWNSRPDTTPRKHAYVYPDWEGSLFQCDALATGCMLIKRHVLEALTDPWFSCWPGTAGGEDFDFCEKARAAGFEVWADFSVQCGHEAQLVFLGAEDFVGVYDIGGPNEYDFVTPVLVEAGPNGRVVKLGVKQEPVIERRERELAGVQ